MTTLLFDRLNALTDPIRCRLLLALERQELAVHELRAALQLPQSTVSRHLKVLADEGWVASRATGTTNWYRMATDLDPTARRLWQVVREQLVDSPATRRDAERVRSVLAERRGRSRELFAGGPGQWERIRTDLFGSGIEWFALAGLVEPDWVVGDLGSGTGQLTAVLAPLVARVIAVDESPAMLEATRASAPADHVDCRQGSLEALPIDDRSLDLACIELVLHHLPEPSRAIDEAARVLKPGGRLVVVDMMPHERTEYRETMGHQWLGFDQDTLFAWATGAGLAPRSYRPLPPQSKSQGPLLFAAAAVKLHQSGD